MQKTWEEQWLRQGAWGYIRSKEDDAKALSVCKRTDLVVWQDPLVEFAIGLPLLLTPPYTDKSGNAL